MKNGGFEIFRKIYRKNTCVGVSFLIKLQAIGKFLTKHHGVTASDNGNIGLRRVKTLKKALNLSRSSMAVTKTVNNLTNCKKKIVSIIIPIKIGVSNI